MKLHIEDPGRSVLPLPVVMTMVTYGVFWIWFLWIMCTLKFRVPGEGTGTTLISSGAYWLGTFSSIGLTVWLAAAFVRTLKRRDSLRMSHLVSLGMAILLMVSMQFGFERLRAPSQHVNFVQSSLIDTWGEMRANGSHPLNFWR
ncbi:MAG: hypothetical protein JKY61_06045 [Planctomycetes bacterium]|nr:hypothetical protein [Planctomycetota bacterium]